MELVKKADSYVDIVVIPSDLDILYDFTFHYRRADDSSYMDNGSISCLSAHTISGNRVYGASGRSTVRWFFQNNDLVKSDGFSIEIRPCPRVEVISGSESSSVRLSSSFGGDGNVNSVIVPQGSISQSLREDGGNIYWNDSLVVSLGSSPDYISYGDFIGSPRIFVVHSSSQRVDEYDTDGSLVNSVSGVFGGDPVMVDYNEVSGDIVTVVGDNFVVVKFKDPSNESEVHPSLGTVSFDYSSSMTGALSGIVSASFGIGEETVSVSTSSSVGRVDMVALSEVVYEYVSFETERADSSSANFPVSGSSYAFDCGNGRMVAVFGAGSELLSDSSRASHESFNRSLGKRANYDIHSGLSNSIFRGISPREVLSFEVLNEEELSDSSALAYGLHDAAYLLKAEADRGNIDSDIPIRGFRQAHVSGGGMQTLVAMTGQTIRCSIPATPVRTGYYVSDGGVSPAYVKESVSVKVMDTTTGNGGSIGAFSVQDGGEFSISVPEASPGSYASSISRGCHHILDVEFEVTESYYADFSFERVVREPRSRKYHVCIVSVWWRQIFKESWGQIDSILSSDIDLENYSELPHQFFNSSTVMLDFCSFIGADRIEPSDDQKANMVFENAFAVLTYSTGMCICDSPVSPIYATNPMSYESEVGDGKGAVFEDISGDIEFDSSLYGLNADYQIIATFSDHPGSQLVSSQSVRDLSRILYISGNSASSYDLQNGLSLIPGSTKVYHSSVSCLSENKQLNIDYGTGLSIDGISFFGNFAMTALPRIGDKEVIIDFSVTSGSPSSISVGLSINGKTTEVIDYSSPYEFEVPALNNGDHLRAYVNISNEDSSEVFSDDFIVTDGDSLVIYGMRITDDKISRLVHIDYSMYADADYIPANVSFSMTIGSNSSFTFVGDVGAVYPGDGKRASASYSSLKDIDMIGTSSLSITATSPVNGNAIGNTSIEFFMRDPSFSERTFDTPAFLAVSENVRKFPKKTDPGNIKDHYMLSDDVGNYILTETISSSGSPSSSSSSFSSSSSLSSSCSSSSSSSSSYSSSSSSYSSSSSSYSSSSSSYSSSSSSYSSSCSSSSCSSSSCSSSSSADCSLVTEFILSEPTFLTNSFGDSVSVYGNYLVVGDELNSSLGSGSGAVFVYVNNGSSWSFTQKIQGDDTTAGDAFGTSVSIYGTRLAVGARNKAGGGAVYVFDLGSSWTQTQKLTSLDIASGDQFGVGVSLYGDRLAVGAHRDNDNGFSSGSAYIFDLSGSWTQTQKLTALDGQANDLFGVRLSLYGDRLCVGAITEDGAGSQRGAAYVFDLSILWTQTQKLTALDASDNALFGCSVSLYQDRIVCGAYNDNATIGAAYVFELSGTWSQTEKITGFVPSRFGYAVSLYGDRIAIGAPGVTNTGRVYVYDFDGSWSQTDIILASDGGPGEEFGESIFVYGGTIAVGAGDAASGDGAAYVYDYPCVSP
jgi:hypothetical protein